MFTCPTCAAVFTRKDNLKRHLKSSCLKTTMPSTSGAGALKRVFDNKEETPSTSSAGTEDRNSKQARIEKSPLIRCPDCCIEIRRIAYQGHLRSNLHKSNAAQFLSEESGIQIIRNAFRDRISSFRVSSLTNRDTNVKDFLTSIRDKIINLVDEQLKKFHSLKVNLEMFGLYILATKELTDIKSFQTGYKIVTAGNNLYDFYENGIDVLDKKESEFQQRDSGTLNYIIIYCIPNQTVYRMGVDSITIPGSEHVEV